MQLKDFNELFTLFLHRFDAQLFQTVLKYFPRREIAALWSF